MCPSHSGNTEVSSTNRVFERVWSVKRGTVEGKRGRQRPQHSPPSVYDCIKLLDSNTEHKGWSRQVSQTPLCEAKWVPRISLPPNMGDG